MDFASDRFDRNIFFISKNRIPENKFKNYIYNRKCIIVLCLNKNHYEIVGRLLPDKLYTKRV